MVEILHWALEGASGGSMVIEKISKSGGKPETRAILGEADSWYKDAEAEEANEEETDRKIMVDSLPAFLDKCDERLAKLEEKLTAQKNEQKKGKDLGQKERDKKKKLDKDSGEWEKKMLDRSEERGMEPQNKNQKLENRAEKMEKKLSEKAEKAKPPARAQRPKRKFLNRPEKEAA